MESDKLFSEVKFFMAQCNKHDEIKDLLIEGGARHINYLSEQVTHVIADSNCPEAEEAVDLYDKPVVTSLWVHLSVKAKRTLPPEAFSPNRAIFNNVVAAFSPDLSETDIEVLAATLTFYGGRLTKDLGHATHFIATSTKPSELEAEQVALYKFKVIAPDWILESVKQNSFLDECPFEPNLLLGPPPPPPPPKPPTPPPKMEIEESSKDTSKNSGDAAIRPITVPSFNGDNEGDMNAMKQNQNLSPSSQQRFQNQQQLQSNPNHQPRMRMTSNVPRGPQPRFRQILPQNPNMIPASRQQLQQSPRMMMSDPQQPRKAGVDYNHAYRKTGPYQPGQDMQPMQQPVHTYQQAQHTTMHQQGPTSNQPSRIPQPNMYQQARPTYQNNQMQPRMNMQQPNMINHQQMQTPPMNRFQDASNQMNQPRPYQVGVQHQTVNSGYQQGQPQRQPVYYNQTMPMRMPQQGPPQRMIMQNDHIAHDVFPQQVEAIQPHQQYQPATQQIYQQHPRHQVPLQPQHRLQQFQQPHPPVVMPSRPIFQSNMPGNARGPRSQASNHQEMKPNIRQPVEKPPRGPRVALIQTQPHPSIFDSKQESSYAQMKAKVPILTDNIQYFDHSPGFVAPRYQPFSNCVFKLVEHSNINPKLLNGWTEAIVDAGGRFSDDTDELTHIICESRSTQIYLEAMKKGIRCITIYWINDVLAEDKMTYPWKALHIPTPFMQDDRPLQNQIISISNFKGRERCEIKEMIKKTGAKCTEYFSQFNTLLICGSPCGEKYEKSIEWSIPIANCQLLSDFLISGRDFSQMLAHAKYQNFNRDDRLRLDSYVLIRDLMQPWTKAVPLSLAKKEENFNHVNGTTKEVPSIHANEDSGLATGGSNNSDTDGVKSKLDGAMVPVVDCNNLQGGGSKTTTPLSVDLKQQQQSTVKPEFSSSDDIDLKTITENMDVDKNIVDNSNSDPEIRTVKALEVQSKPEVASVPEIDDVETTNEVVLTSGLSTTQDNVEGLANEVNVKPARRTVRTSDKPIRILFTHLEPKLVKQLEAYALELGLGLAGSPVDCTHLVVNQISRTPKFICAFSHAEFILSLGWLMESHEAGQVLDEMAFILRDSEGEKKFSFNLAYSLLKRGKRKSLLFSNFIFFVTPTVLATVKNLKEMIESAGGKITTRKLPTLAQLNQIRTSGKRFVVITNQQDLHLCSSADQIGVDLLRVEFVISGILRQDVDLNAHRISLRQPAKNAIEAPSTNSIVAPSPSKKCRSE